MITGRRTVGATAAPIFSTETSERCRTGIEIKASAGNAGTIYVGTSSGVTADLDDDTDGYPLAAGQSILLPFPSVQDPNQVHVIASTSGQKYWFILV